MVEVTGLEPAASCSQSRHSSQTELHLDICKTPAGVLPTFLLLHLPMLENYITKCRVCQGFFQLLTLIWVIAYYVYAVYV